MYYEGRSRNDCREGRQRKIDGALFCQTILPVAISRKVGQYCSLGLPSGPFPFTFRPKVRVFVNFFLRSKCPVNFLFSVQYS